jgi:late competence protein required for DNA uptake (superfamily II DNA/RNA helicase)
MIPFEEKAEHSILHVDYIRTTQECPLKKLRQDIGNELIYRITSKISCSSWVQVTCSRCNEPILTTHIYTYCSSPYCASCYSYEKMLDEQQ